MMKDDDSLYRRIDPITHRCLVQSCTIRINDIRLQLFSYSYNLFFRCYNLSRFQFSYTLSVSIISSLLSTLLVFHHSLIHFIKKLCIQSFITSTSPTPTFYIWYNSSVQTQE